MPSQIPYRDRHRRRPRRHRGRVAARASAASRSALSRCGPDGMTPAHHTDLLAELVCSNSLKSDDPDDRCRAAQARARRRSAASCSRRARDTACPPAPRSPSTATAFSRAAHRRVSSRTRSSSSCARRPTRCPRATCIIATGPLTSEAFEPALAAARRAPSASPSSTPPRPIVDARARSTAQWSSPPRATARAGEPTTSTPDDTRASTSASSTRSSRAERVDAKDFERKRAVLGVPAGRGGRPHRAATHCASAR